MKKFLITILILFTGLFTYAKHIPGGEMFYEFLYSTATTKTYRITLILFRDEYCVSTPTSMCAPMPDFVIIGIFNNDDNSPYGGLGTLPGINATLLKTEAVPILNPPLCLTSEPNLKYTVGYYSIAVTLRNNQKGYTAAYQTCCRIDNINNIDPKGDLVGATYSTVIPGLNNLSAEEEDNSPTFFKGISIICFNKFFKLDFSAVDKNGDQLIYSLCDAYNGGSAQDASPITPSIPPYQSLDYIIGYSGLKPLGIKADIDPQTGIISGIAPKAGKYVVSVCVDSYRKGKYIATHRKDFIITVSPCDYASAELFPEYTTCDGYSFDFSNQNQSPLILDFYWDFNDPSSGANNISTDEFPTHLFSDTGTFKVKLVVNKGTPCADSAISIVKVYPDFTADFIDNSPMCKNLPVKFTDQSVHNFGKVVSWKWDFGLPDNNKDTSSLKNPIFIYSEPGAYNVRLIVGSNRGCYDTIKKIINIVNKPNLSLLTKDTILCIKDNLQLNASSSAPGNISWSPAYNISNPNSFNPVVSPKVDTTYYINFLDNYGCSNTDSVKIKVISTVTLDLLNDTTICKTDTIILKSVSNGLKFEWTPDPTLKNINIQSPEAIPVDASTTYFVKASVGSCFATNSVNIKTIPYPIAIAGKDTSICVGGSAKLSVSGGSAYKWIPSTFLDNPNSANPNVINPSAGIINYIVSVTDVLGCPKPVYDTTTVSVLKVIADAGPKDTAVVAGQPLQLNATGGSIYEWTPTDWLNNPKKANPISNPKNDIEYTVKVSNDIGCVDTDKILVKYYKVLPDIYLPNAFSPNGDGINDIIRPIALGIKSIEIFSIFNRWGELIFNTSQIGKGWDGKFKGKKQENGTYVWYAIGTDYTNRKIEKKGTLILIR